MLVSVHGGYVSVYSSGLNLERRGHTNLMKWSWLLISCKGSILRWCTSLNSANFVKIYFFYQELIIILALYIVLVWEHPTYPVAVLTTALYVHPLPLSISSPPLSLSPVSAPCTKPGKLNYTAHVCNRSSKSPFIGPQAILVMHQITPTTLLANQWQSRRNSGTTV